MAAPVPTPKTASHTRSISLPTRSHPLTLCVEQQLHRIRTTGVASKPSSSTSACQSLTGLKDLYQCVDDMLHTQLAQQSLSSEQHGKCFEDVLDRSISYMDVCSATRDVLSLMRGSVQNLESSLRRRRGEDCGYANDILEYMVCKKKVNKMAGKCIGNLKKLVKHHGSVHLDGERSLSVMIGVLREVEEISFQVLESFLSFISKPKAVLTQSNWFRVSKLMQSKRVAGEGEQQNCDEVDKVDAALDALKCHSNVKQMQNVLKPLEALELSFQEIEEELDSVLGCLIRIRVSLLNVLSH
ncbi:hypothetical protein RJ639_028587 [Escallonia herrerae]|uniref:DUF241 domain protein n=1 Tax=Escallonia herrerae TaxID=1293975 RepID=A0AA89BE85_9ASTE|nr:hypothetical protein RJ639_028587 [Escallonia herrerae]